MTFRLQRFSMLLGLLGLVLMTAAPAAPAAARQQASRMSSDVPATSAAARIDALTQRQHLRARSLVADVPFRNVGPTVMSGRAVDIDADPDDPTTFYVAYASGGLWKTSNNGQSFEPLFDDQAVMTIGDIAVDWDRGETIWVGTGENNSSRSSYAGTGVYRSTDGGASWQHLGLTETQHTGRIVLHPDDPNTAWVAAAGALYSADRHRGIYKTTDGGASWQQTLFVNDNTGAIDLIMEPGNPAVLYAALWERTRRAWNFVEGGEGSGIYKSTDGGDTWTLVSGAGSGFPTGAGIGRIGLDSYPGNPDVIYALLDNQNRRPDDDEDDDADRPAVTRDALRTMTQQAFLALQDREVEAFLRAERFPTRYTGASVQQMVRAGDILPAALVEYLEDANSQLFDTPVIGAEVYRSDDGGRTWARTHDDYLEAVYNSYGYYFGEIRVAPDTPDRIYILGVPLLMSEDGGATWASIGGPHVHSDHQALWVNPNRPHHLINGNDGGVNLTYDDGASWFKANTPSVGQFYSVQVDDAEPYNVYGGLQDNGVWMGPSSYTPSYRWYASGAYPYEGLFGGDGMQVEVDTRTNELVYAGSQFGFYGRVNTRTGERISFRPRHELGERPLRFNWQVPIHLSRHHQDILYYGSNRLHRSMNQGGDFDAISPDLTKGGRPGDVPYGTLATIDESPLRFGLLYTGSDDGYVHVSRDGGASWTRISDDLPQDLWVSRVEASHHAEPRVYVTLNGYRWDHFTAYVYRSDDYGATWRQIGQDLPAEPVNVIVEDPANENLLYVGTDHGVYLSLDGGQSFMGMQGGLPDAPVHDLKVQAREKDLVVGTHGRSIFIGDVSHVQQLDDALMAEAVHLFALEDQRYNSGWGRRFASWRDAFVPEVDLALFAGRAGTATLRVKAEDGALLRQWTTPVARGLHYTPYHLTADPDRAAAYNRTLKDADDEATLMEAADDGQWYLLPGTYTVEVDLGGDTATAPLKITERGRRPGAVPAATPRPGSTIK